MGVSKFPNVNPAITVPFAPLFFFASP